MIMDSPLTYQTSAQNTRQELDKIREIAGNLKYPNNFIDNAFNKAKKNFYSMTTTKEFENKNILVLPFNNSFENIPRMVKPLGINIVFKTTDTVKNLLIKNSPCNKAGCVYSIPCKHCNRIYIGQSGKKT